MKRTIEQKQAESATGCNENPHGLGSLYASGGRELSIEEAQSLVRDTCIEIPNAGAGSYRRVFEMLGFPKTEVFEWTSSAGDWSFCVFDGALWYSASQSNRYPRHGFAYGIDKIGFETLEECQSYMMQ